MKQPANDNPNLALAAAQLGEESARHAVDGRIAIFRSVVGSVGAGPKSAGAAIARQDVLEAMDRFLNEIEGVQIARLNVLFGGRK